MDRGSYELFDIDVISNYTRIYYTILNFICYNRQGYTTIYYTILFSYYLY